MSVSFDKFVFDEEVLSRLFRLRCGLGQWPEDLENTFVEAQKAGGYLKLKSTLKSFRKEYYRPTLGDRRGFEVWKKEGQDLREQAWNHVHNRLNSYEIPPMDSQALSDLTAVLKKHTGQPAPALC
jgi:trimethylamine--corrinoid protein Co-methyltransferase